MKTKYFYSAYFIAFLSFYSISSTNAQNFLKVYDPLDQYASPLNNIDKSEQGITFLFYNYSSEHLDLSHFKLSHPDISAYIPAKVSVNPPARGWVNNLVYGVTFLYSGEKEKGCLIILFVGDHDSKFPKYFIDYNLDYNFNTDKGPYVFPDDSKKFKQVVIKQKKGQSYEFLLLNPDYQYDVVTESFSIKDIDPALTDSSSNEIYPTSNSGPDQHLPHIRDLHNKGLLANISFLIGGGKISYHTLDSDYRVHYNPRGLALNLSYTLRNFEFGLTGTFEATYYQTSFLQKEVNYFSNIDRHPRKKYSFGLFAGYHIPLHRLVAFQPYIHFGGFTFNNNSYIPDYVNYPEVSHKLQVKNQYGAGLKLSILAGNRSSLTIFGQYNNLTFDPEGLFPEGSSSSNSLVTMGMGFSYKIF